MNIFTIWIGKTLMTLTKLFHLGSGGAWPGEIVLILNKNFLKRMESKLKYGSIVITGTNGKTTTSLLISSILEKAGYSVLHNNTGANLMNGIVSSILKNTNWFGNIKKNIAVFEVDEANLPILLKNINPKIIALLNLSRDQLDRYGEVEIMVEKWKNAINEQSGLQLVINSDDKRLNKFEEIKNQQITTFSSKDNFTYHLPLLGKHNKLNIMAAVKIARILDVKVSVINKTLKKFKPAFGRGENFKYKNSCYKMMLAKNPASFNVNLQTIKEDIKNYDALLFILNDNIPDGRDISWIYDINPELLYSVCKNKKIFISGTRHHDMALRLKYAGVNYKNFWYSHDIEKMLQAAAIQTNNKQLSIVLPTYSAMLQSRKILCGRKIL